MADKGRARAPERPKLCPGSFWRQLARVFVSEPLNNGGSSAVLGGRDHVLYPPTCTILPATSLSITDQLRAIPRFHRGRLFDSISQRVGKLPPPHITDIDGATRVERMHRGSTPVAQASRRVWVDDFRRDPPLNRSLASRSRCLGSRSI